MPYCAAKAAVLGMTRAMARELSDRGIRVNAVNPGATETPIYATLPAEMKDAIAADSLMKRLAHPDEIAGAVAFLAGDDGSTVVGLAGPQRPSIGPARGRLGHEGEQPAE